MNVNFKHFIPGLLLAATGVGAGDLITGGLAGVYTGLIFVITPLIGALFKYFLNLNLAHQHIENKKLFVTRLNEQHIILRLFFFFYIIFWTYSVGSALLNACASASIAFFNIANFNPQNLKIFFGILIGLCAFIIVKFFNTKTFEKIMSLFVFIMFFTVITCCIFIFLNDDPINLQKEKINSKFILTNIEWALALIGGVGGTLTILSYDYWLNDELKILPKENILRIIKIDLKTSYFITAIFSICMIYLGSKLGNFSENKSLFPLFLANFLQAKTSLSFIHNLFLIGFWCGVVSSLIGVYQSVPLIFKDFMIVFFKKHNLSERKLKNYFLIYLCFIPMSSLFFKFVFIQKLYAILGAFFMPFLAISLLIMNQKTGLDQKYNYKFGLIAILVFYISYLFIEKYF